MLVLANTILCSSIFIDTTQSLKRVKLATDLLEKRQADAAAAAEKTAREFELLVTGMRPTLSFMGNGSMHRASTRSSATMSVAGSDAGSDAAGHSESSMAYSSWFGMRSRKSIFQRDTVLHSLDTRGVQGVGRDSSSIDVVENPLNKLSGVSGGPHQRTDSGAKYGGADTTKPLRRISSEPGKLSFDVEGGEGQGGCEGNPSEEGGQGGGREGAGAGVGDMSMSVGTTASRVADELGAESDEEEPDSPIVVLVDVEAGSWVTKDVSTL